MLPSTVGQATGYHTSEATQPRLMDSPARPSVPEYRLTLYHRLADGQWQYCQMTAGESHLQTSLGRCGGYPPLQVDTVALEPGADPQLAVRAAGAQWRERGFDYPRRNELKILTIHFRVPVWTGFPAGAPWFEDWKTYYQEPIEVLLDATVNGFAKGVRRGKGWVSLFYYVLDAEAARQGVEALAEAAPVSIPFTTYVGDREHSPDASLHDGVPGPLAGLFEHFGEVAEASQQLLFHTVALTPQPVHTSSRARIKGAEAMAIRQKLYERWGFNCQGWPPLGGSAPETVVYVRDLPLDKTYELQAWLIDQLQEPAYLLDCDDGLFRLDSQQLLRGAYEGIVFDAGLEWAVYFSHHHTITFAGKRLIEHVRSLYKDQPEILHTI